MTDDRAKPAIAVALDYAEGTRQAPVVVAKGRGLSAEQILKIARENGITVEANPMLAEALSGVPLDDSIPHELYQAVAEVIGQKIKQVAGRHQVLCITHLPQIAVYGDRHFVVSKREVGERTASTVRALGETERMEEVARMLGGIKVTDRTREAAAEMLRAAVE